MPSKTSLSPADREFFQWVAAAAFTNPFSAQRLEFDRKIAGATFKDETERAESDRKSVV